MKLANQQFRCNFCGTLAAGSEVGLPTGWTDEGPNVEFCSTCESVEPRPHSQPPGREQRVIDLSDYGIQLERDVSVPVAERCIQLDRPVSRDPIIPARRSIQPRLNRKSP